MALEGTADAEAEKLPRVEAPLGLIETLSWKVNKEIITLLESRAASGAEYEWSVSVS